MATLSELRDRIWRVLSDAQGQQYASYLIDDGINAGLEAILPWVFKNSVAEYEGDGAATAFELPADLYRVVAVLDTDSGLYIPQNSLSAGQAPGADLLSNQDWMEYPEGYLSLANAPDGDIVVYYAAVWDTPVNDADDIEAPVWVHRALVFYAASYALLDKASSASNIRQWNVKVDSGTPVMNPMKDMSTYFLDRFRIEMDRIPARARGSHG